MGLNSLRNHSDCQLLCIIAIVGLFPIYSFAGWGLESKMLALKRRPAQTLGC